VRWYDIQQQFHYVKFDVLLLLDCCYAGLAARGGAAYLPPGPVELLAAAGDTTTPAPGDGSFTAAMVEMMGKHLKEHNQISISAVYRDLVHRKSDLYALPYHVHLREGPSERSIVLRPKESENRGTSLPFWKAEMDLTVRFEHDLTERGMNAIIRWLRTEAVRTGVSELRVNSVLKTTKDLGTFVEQTKSGSQNPIVKTLEISLIEQVGHAWSALEQLVTQLEYCAIEATDDSGSNRVSDMTTQIFELIDGGSSRLLRIFQDAVLMSHVSSDLASIEEAMKDPASDLLQLKSQLGLRRIICGADISSSELSIPQPNGILEEFKKYGEHQSKSQTDEIAARLELLASVLKAEKPEEFRCLRLYKWKHLPLQRRFVYQFSIPNHYQKLPITLNQAILSLRNRSRPTLEDRLAMAYRIAKAVQHWHRVDWVHQGISAHNVLFFRQQPETQTSWSFKHPMLQGFDFSRPNAKPSLEHYVQSIEDDVYRHPERQGPSCDGHRKIHDLYSLGVVLLEIGLWSTALDIVNARIKKHIASQSGQRAEESSDRDITPSYMAKSLLEAAQQKLSHYVGTEYQEAVLTCLTSRFGVLEDDRRDKRLLEAVDKLVLKRLAENYGR
jgi:hypothetical protein